MDGEPVFVTVIHRIHDPEGFQAAEAKALEAGLPAHVALPIHALPTITDSASASGKANRSTPCVRWLKARSDHGRTTSTTRCTWTDLRRSSESSRRPRSAVRRGSPAGGPRCETGTWSAIRAAGHRAALSSSDMAGTYHVGAGSLT